MRFDCCGSDQSQKKAARSGQAWVIAAPHTSKCGIFALDGLPARGYAAGMPKATQRAKPSEARASLIYWIVVAMLVVAALTGGASREDSIAQALIRGSLPLLLAVIVLIGRPREFDSLKRLSLLFLALVVLMAAMLVPLPPSAWLALPGRELIEPAAPLAGMPQVWRPWALSPPLAHNALYALIPPGCVLFAMFYLTPDERAKLVAPLAATVAASALLGVAQISGGEGGPLRWYAVHNRGAGIGFFANRNHQALFLAIGILLMASWSVKAYASGRIEPLRVGVAGLAALLFCVALLATGSRAGLVLMVVAIIGGILMLRKALTSYLAKASARIRLMAVGGAFAALGVLIAFAVLSPQGRTLSRLFELERGDDLRTRALPTITEMVVTYFPAGAGFGGFEPTFRAHEPFALLARQYLNEAHNDYLQLAVEGGLAGLLVLAAFAAWWLLTSWRILRHSAPRHPYGVLPAAGALIVLLVGLASLVDYPVRTPLMMITLLLACVWMELPRAEGSRRGALPQPH